ncbi:MAG: protein translocase subunit SecD [Verrucomicrobia bacterium]|nr:protein translocase subunit SecD [Verrucomicrobiota bacterium]
MLKRNLWKLILSVAVLAWAGSQLLPLQDQAFADYVRTHASAKSAEFGKLLEEAAARKKALQAPSEFVALKQLGRERRLDLTQYFPHIRLEESLKNIEKRNDILLAELLRLSRGRLQLGLDLKGGVAFTLEAVDSPGEKLDSLQRQEKLQKSIEIIGARINGLGVAEPVLRPIGENRIEVQLPGVSTKDNPDVVDQVKAPARLDFRMIHASLVPGPGVETPAGYEVKTLDWETRRGETGVEELFVKRIPEMTGEMISNSFARPDLYGKPEVILEFTDAGKNRFAEVTRSIAEIGQRGGPLGRLAIVLDGKLYSAPTVREEINSPSAQITGSFTDREAINLANVLNNPLDVELRIIEQYEVGPTLAADAVISARNAFIVSTLLTIGFIVVFYTIGGFVAAFGMAVNVLVTLGVMASIGATLTMPGIAGIVLTLAMSVDANILIFERMREELKLGKSLGTALEAGFDKAWSAILDSNVTTLLVALVMVGLGTGPVKGFGVTLAIGIFTTMFAAIVVNKLILEALIFGGVTGRLPMFSILQNTAYDFLKYTRAAFIATAAVLVVGIGAVVYKGKAIYGIDFVGGDMITLNFGQRVEVGELRRAAERAGQKDVAFSYQQPVGGSREVLRITAPFDQGRPLVRQLQTAFPQAKLELAGESRIGASVGKEIQWNALLSVVAALAGILVYVAFRFEMGYGIGAVVATVHDLILTIGLFVLFDRQFNAPMVAAILLIIGYSINDTIVVFDRIREELKLNPTGTLREIINRSLNLTLARTVITGGTTLLTSVTLLLTTSGDVNDIAFTLLIGVLTGTFSSLFIATPVFFWWHKGDRKHVEAHHDVAPKYEWQGTSKAAE